MLYVVAVFNVGDSCYPFFVYELTWVVWVQLFKIVLHWEDGGDSQLIELFSELLMEKIVLAFVVFVVWFVFSHIIWSTDDV